MSRLGALVRAAVDAVAVSFFLAIVGNLALQQPLDLGFLGFAWGAGAAVGVAAAVAAGRPRPRRRTMMVRRRASPFCICFFSSVQYSQPLDATSEKKFRAMKRLGDIVVIGFSTGLAPRDFEEHARFRLLPWLSAPALRYPLLFTWGSALALRVVLGNESSIVVAQSPYEGFAAALVKSVGRLCGRHVALVVESHGDFEISPFLQRRFALPSLYRFLILHLSRFALQRADALRVISSSTREQVERWAPGRPTVQFPTWTDIEPFLTAGGRNRPAESSPTFVYAGVLIERKGVDVLIEAFAIVARRWPSARLEIIGKAEDPRYHRALVDQTRVSRIEEQVCFVPHLAQADIAEHMARGVALVLPSVSEGLGRVVFEAMASGTLVIGSRVGGIVDMIVDGENGLLVPAGDSAALAQRMGEVLEHPETAREMGRKAREFARRYFTTESYVASYQDLFEIASGSVASENGATAMSP